MEGYFNVSMSWEMLKIYITSVACHLSLWDWYCTDESVMEKVGVVWEVLWDFLVTLPDKWCHGQVRLCCSVWEGDHHEWQDVLAAAPLLPLTELRAAVSGHPAGGPCHSKWSVFCECVWCTPLPWKCLYCWISTLPHPLYSFCLTSSFFLSLQSLILIFSLSQSHLFRWMWGGSKIIASSTLY